jgi:glycosyltransferase involved in cell wall biosynthesis
MPRVLILLSETPWGAVNAVRRAAMLLPERFDVSVHDVRPDWRNWWATRRRVTKTKPDVVHAVGPQASNALMLCDWTGARGRSRFVTTGTGGPQLTPVLYRDADPPGGVPPDLPAHFVLAAGGFDHTANLKAAVWAFDVLKYTDPRLRLVLLGDGPLRRQVEHLARHLGHDDYRVHFAGWQDDVRPYLRQASVVWVTHRKGGTTFALEAMASGVPVVALNTPDTSAFVNDDDNGLLVPFDDPVRLAAVTRKLLADAGRRDRIGCAGRAAASARPIATLVEAMTTEYDRLTRTADLQPGKTE